VRLTSARVRIRRPTGRETFWGLLAFAALSWTILGSSYNTFTATTAVVAAIVLLSAGVVAGDAGMASLCQISFAALSGWVLLKFAEAGDPLPPLLEMVIAVLASTGLGIVVGLPALRLRSVNLAIVTLGVGLAVETFLVAQRFPADSRIDRPFFAQGDLAFFLFCLICFGVIAYTLDAIRRRPLGGVWQSVKHSERATAAMGYSVTWAKLSVFAVGATIAGLGGILTVMLIGVADVTTFPAVQSLILFAAAVFIGAWRWQGALFAGVASVAIPEVLKTVGWSRDVSRLLFGVGATQALASGSSVADALWPRRTVPIPPDIDDAWHERSGAFDAPAPLGVADAASSPPVMAIRGLSVRYGGVVAVDDLQLEVRDREIVGLIGANGAGKTSVVDAMSGYVDYSGTVELNGVRLEGSPQGRARAGLRRTFQQDRVVPTLTAAQYLRLAARRSLSPADIDHCLAFAGVRSRDALVGQFEGATRRLLEVAGAFASQPSLVLLDEPVAGLAGAEGLQFADRLGMAPSMFGCAVLVIEHDVDFVRSVCSRVVVMDFGKAIAEGTLDDVLRTNVVRVAYLGQLDVT
jgi:branched-chain amino acid transport system permease protein